MAQGSNRRLGVGLLAVLLVAVVLPAVLVAGHATAEAAGPPGFFECTPGSCPDTTGVSNNNGPLFGTDGSVSVFVGGDMTVGGEAAESEGRTVVIGDFVLAKTSGSDRYDVGEAGGGSRITPPAGTPFMEVGGDITVAAGLNLEVGSTLAGNLEHAGALVGPGNINASGSINANPNAVSAYSGIPAAITALGTCLSSQTANGTHAGGPSNVTFTGDGVSPIQIFEYNADITGFGGNGNGGYAFANIPAGATVIVNFTGADTVRINTFTGASGGTLGSGVTREQVLFNIPSATTVELGGQPQFQGSVLVGNPASTTTNMWSGLDGRFYTAGSLIHDALAGIEFHNYPFTGEFPAACEGAPPTPGTITIIKDTVPEIDQDFGFSAGGLAPATFTLNDDGTGATDRQDFTNVTPGTYTVTEDPAPGYTTTVVCSDADSTAVGATATIIVADSERDCQTNGVTGLAGYVFVGGCDSRRVSLRR